MSSKAKLVWCLLAPLLAAALFEFVVVALDIAPRRAQSLRVWNERRDDELDAEDGAYRFHPRWLWELRPGALVDGDVINDDAYRGPRVEPESHERLRIAAIGESSTFGMGVRESEAWPRALERRLRAEGLDVEVLNFGVVGHTIAQGRELYLGRARDFRPDIVVACYLCINESGAAPGGLIDGVKIELVQSSTFRTRMFLDRFASLRWLMGMSGGTVAPDAVVRGPTHGQVPRVNVEHFGAMTELWSGEVRADGAAFVMVSPARTARGEEQQPKLLEYTAALEQRAKELAIPLADVRSAFARRAAEPDAPELFLDTWHPTPIGHELYAEVIAETLKRAGLLEAALNAPPAK